MQWVGAINRTSKNAPVVLDIHMISEHQAKLITIALIEFKPSKCSEREERKCDFEKPNPFIHKSG